MHGVKLNFMHETFFNYENSPSYGIHICVHVSCLSTEAVIIKY